jgi:excinuclease ABC subunit A
MSRSRQTAPPPAAIPDAIRLRGVRQNNLKGFDLDLPLGQMIVVTGPSGSGKSSLAFQTLYAEGQRRYVETFSPYVRQFFDRMDKPKVDRIDGIPPAIAIEQVNNVRSTRSTVGTITEINDYLKILFARAARGFCPQTGLEVRPDSTESVLRHAREKLAGRELLVLFPVAAPAGAEPADFFTFLGQQGFLRVRIFGEIFRTDEPAAYPRKTLPAVVLVVQDRVKVERKNLPRLTEAVEAALHFGKGGVTLAWQEDGQWREQVFTKDWLCPESGIRLSPPTPGLFSFNSPVGACPACRGFGKTIGLDLDLALPDKSLSLRAGVVKAFQGGTYEECQRDLLRCAKSRGLALDEPFEDLDRDDQEWVLHGEPGYPNPDEAWQAGAWYGVKGFFTWLESKTYKMHVRVFLSRYRAYTRCASCGGSRLRPESLHYKLGGLSLADCWQLPVAGLLALLGDEARVPPRARDGGALDPATLTVRGEILSRLRYLVETGLGYLSLGRETRTLSGGETARVNLTTCLGTALTGTLFVLDEPSVGLHPRDTRRLLAVMAALRDRGNTLVVVEHEEAVIRAADHLVDIGPGRGEAGGELLYSGPLGAFTGRAAKGAPPSLTRDYLTGAKAIGVPAGRRKPAAWLEIRGAAEHNLQNIDVRLPLGTLCCVTGVSGSGKSTLVHKVLFENLARQLGQAGGEGEPGRCREIRHGGRVKRALLVDQSPLSRTPRSTPAVYLGIFDLIRRIFADTEDGRAVLAGPGLFSFNSGPGRCPRCTGMGFEKVEMQFLSDLFVTCPECEGRRYTAATLEIRFEDKSIADVLDLTCDQARDFFRNIPRMGNPEPQRARSARVAAALDVLAEVGLGYLRLGQPLNTLSGGEAQRLKLVSHLLEADPALAAATLLVFDEPTTGLHFDDIALLLAAFQRLVDQGNSLVVIEHNLEVVKCADHVVDLGPGAGTDGGLVVAAGTPEDIAAAPGSLTGRYLAPLLGAASGPALAAEDEPPPVRPAARRGARADAIRILGAREHNLKNISLDIPRGRFVVVTGLSGSANPRWPSTSSSPRASGDSWIRCRPTRGSSPSRWKNPMSITSRACPRPSPSNNGSRAAAANQPSAPSPRFTSSCACSLPRSGSSTARFRASRSRRKARRRSRCASRRCGGGGRWRCWRRWCATARASTRKSPRGPRAMATNDC